MPLTEQQIDLIGSMMPKADVSSFFPGVMGGSIGGLVGQAVSPRAHIPGILAGTILGVTGSGRRRGMEEAALRQALINQPNPLDAEDIRRLAKRVSPTAPTVGGTALGTGLLSGALGAAGGGWKGALGAGAAGAGLGALLGAIHAAANRARVRELMRMREAQRRRAT